MLNVDQFLSKTSGAGSRFMMKLWKKFLLRGYRRQPHVSLPLGKSPAPLVEKLGLINRGEGPPVSTGLIVGTVRMGYGHHRVAAAAYSWALAQGVETYLHDLLAIDAPESKIIAGIDKLYSRMSRLASEIGGPVEWLWGKTMSRGNLNSLRLSCMLADELQALMGNLNRDIPMISTYPLNGQMAVASGFKRVVNMIVDNYPQYFLLVPEAMNVVQSPGYYTRLREMGVPARHLEIGGHWVNFDIVNNLPLDCGARIQRVRDKKPRRVLLPIGGAGAQKKYVSKLLQALTEKLHRGVLRIYLNTGDHQQMFAALVEVLMHLGIDYQVVQGFSALEDFCRERALDQEEPAEEKPVTIFHFNSHFEAFTATDRLVRVADIMATKPSELAFIPIPKLHIRRVGDHEAASAFRSQELGDGSYECREVAQAIQLLGFFCEEDDLQIRMNESIIKNNERGLYNGGKIAVELALSLK